jgi:6-phosphogluconate dehydrogenase
MKLAMIGLGKMGANMATRLLNGDHQVIAFDLDQNAVQAMQQQGATAAYSLTDVVAHMSAPRIAWVMVPAGNPTEQTLTQLAAVLSSGDIIIDGGNSNYKDTVRRAAWLKKQGFHFIDVGTSGGVWGLAEGYSMMLGGELDVIEALRPIFETLAPAADQGWGHVGPNGAGHFVKMIHNGIEYGLMQAYAEGLDLLKHKDDFELDLYQITQIWRYGSVIRSWLLDLTSNALADNPNLDGIAAYVTDSGEGRWTVAEAIELGCSIPVISIALQQRFRSRASAPFADKLLAAMRQQFGGHTVQSE